MKYIKPLIAVLVIGGLLAWMFITLRDNKEIIDEKAQIEEPVIAEIPVRVARAEQRPVDQTLNLTGTFEARKELNLIAEAQGRITQLLVKEGQRVSAGQIVARIDDTNIQAQLRTAIASREKAQKDVERYERLVNAGAISQQQYEEVKLGYQNAQANVTAVEQQLKYTTARSPMSGIVKELSVEQGSFVSPGSSIASVVDIGQLKMVVRVDEQDIIRIQKGQTVAISTDVYPEKTFRGTVELIGLQADAARKYEVEIGLPNPTDTPLRPGMYGAVGIEPNSAERQMALYVARKAIVGSVQAPQVYVVGPDQAVHYQPVTVGEIIGDQVEVRSGLQAGDLVVTSGQVNLSEGKRVHIVNAEEVAQLQSPR